MLRTLPWARVDIELVSVETDLAGRVMEGTRGDIIQYMGDQGYIHRSVWTVRSLIIFSDVHYVRRIIAASNHVFNCRNHHSHSKVNQNTKDDLFIRRDVARRLHVLKEDL